MKRRKPGRIQETRTFTLHCWWFLEAMDFARGFALQEGKGLSSVIGQALVDWIDLQEPLRDSRPVRSQEEYKQALIDFRAEAKIRASRQKLNPEELERAIEFERKTQALLKKLAADSVSRGKK